MQGLCKPNAENLFFAEVQPELAVWFLNHTAKFSNPTRAERIANSPFATFLGKNVLFVAILSQQKGTKKQQRPSQTTAAKSKSYEKKCYFKPSRASRRKKRIYLLYIIYYILSILYCLLSSRTRSSTAPSPSPSSAPSLPSGRQ